MAAIDGRLDHENHMIRYSKEELLNMRNNFKGKDQLPINVQANLVALGIFKKGEVNNPLNKTTENEKVETPKQ